MKNYFTGIFLTLLFAFSLQSCYQLKIVPKEAMAATPDTSVTKCVFLWGALQPTIAANGCYGNGITNVRMKTNLGFILISVVSLGTVVPMTVVWNCAKDNCP